MLSLNQNKNSFIQEICDSKRPCLLNDNMIFNGTPEYKMDESAYFMAFPIVLRNEINGLFILGIDQEISPSDESIITVMLSQAGVAIENAEYFEQVEKMAITDALTNLYNRRYFLKLAQTKYQDSVKNKKSFQVVLFDIDHFKKVNDTYGHQAGDKTLVETSATLKSVFSKNAHLARYGGEEFIALVDENTDALALAEEVRAKVENSIINFEGTDIKVTVSMGVASLQESESLENLIKRADEALYTAKDTGRNRVVNAESLETCKV